MVNKLPIITQYKNKLLSYLFYLMCILFHKIGLVISVVGFSVYYIENILKIIEQEDYFKKIFLFLKKEIKYILIFILIYVLAYFVDYDFSKSKEINVFTTYQLNFDLTSILQRFKE